MLTRLIKVTTFHDFAVDVVCELPLGLEKHIII